MKKVLFILFLIILLSGCSTATDQTAVNYNEKSIDPQSSSYNESEVMSRIIDLRNGAKPVIKPDSKTSQTPSQPSTQSMPLPPADNMPKPMQLEELASVYGAAIIKTNLGNIKVSFYAQESPLTVNNFLNLAKKGFYDKTKFHRVMTDFMIQGGDPNSKDDDWSNDGMGDPGYKFQDEINTHKLVRGSLAMANSGPNTNGSQFFIVTKESTPWLDGKHTNFGYVTEGMDIVTKIEALPVNEDDHPTQDAIVNNIELVE